MLSLYIENLGKYNEEEHYFHYSLYGESLDFSYDTKTCYMVEDCR